MCVHYIIYARFRIICMSLYFVTRVLMKGNKLFLLVIPRWLLMYMCGLFIF